MPFSGDRAFGPQYNSESDFTLTFEHLVLTIIPASLLVLVTPFNLRRYLRNKHEPEVGRLSEVLLIFRLVRMAKTPSPAHLFSPILSRHRVASPLLA